MNRNGTAIAMHQHGSGILDLARSGAAPNLAHGFEHMEKAAAEPAMPRREQTAVSGGRKLAMETDASTLNKSAAFAFLAESQILEFDDDGDGKAIIELCDVDVRVLEAGHCKRLAP